MSFATPDRENELLCFTRRPVRFNCSGKVGSYRKCSGAQTFSYLFDSLVQNVENHFAETFEESLQLFAPLLLVFVLGQLQSLFGNGNQGFAVVFFQLRGRSCQTRKLLLGLFKTDSDEIVI